MYQSRLQNKKKRADRVQKKRELEFPDENNGTYFAIVKDMLGNGRVRVMCEDGGLKMARIPGRMRKSRKKTIIDRNDLVMVSGRDFEDKLDILYKYTPEEVSQIIRDYEVPEKIYKSLTESDFCRTEGTEDTIIFCDKNDETDADTENENGDDPEKEDRSDEEIDIDAI